MERDVDTWWLPIFEAKGGEAEVPRSSAGTVRKVGNGGKRVDEIHP